MARRPRLCPPGLPVHVIQRGNNKNICFASNADIASYANWLHEAALKYSVDIHGWVFMTNHVHLLLTPQKDMAISNMMQYLGRCYVRRYNHRYSRSGTLFEGRFKSSVIQDDVYLLACLQYIELNPVRAGMVTDPGDYRWSSYAAHGFGKKIGMWTPHPTYLALDKNMHSREAKYTAMINKSLDTNVISMIRHCASKGLILGTDQFRKQFGDLTANIS